MDSLPYRPCVGMVLANRDGRIFAGQRLDSDFDAWQMPQGGIDGDEAPLNAALRELCEETGVTENLVKLIAELPDWLDYDLPEELIAEIWNGKFRGQRQKWFLFQFNGEDSDINIHTAHPEFSEWKWMRASEVIDNAVWFKSETYRQVVGWFETRLQNMPYELGGQEPVT